MATLICSYRRSACQQRRAGRSYRQRDWSSLPLGCVSSEPAAASFAHLPPSFCVCLVRLASVASPLPLLPPRHPIAFPFFALSSPTRSYHLSLVGYQLSLFLARFSCICISPPPYVVITLYNSPPVQHSWLSISVSSSPITLHAPHHTNPPTRGCSAHASLSHPSSPGSCLFPF